MRTLLWQESAPLTAQVTLTAGLLAAVLWAVTGRAGPAAGVLAAYAALLALLLWFYRAPDAAAFALHGADAAENARRLYAPADGQVRAVRYDAAAGEFTVVIYLNIFNQHQQYYPVDGTVVSSTHRAGTFAPAYLLVKSAHNERHATTLRADANGAEVTVVQLAGQWARRIVNTATPGEHVAQGERMGMIKFSSRVDVTFAARHYVPAVQVGDKVRAMHTVLARAVA